MTGWGILQSSIVSRMGGLAREEKACLSGRDFLLHCLVRGEHPIVSAGLLQCTIWWKQMPHSPNEDEAKGMGSGISWSINVLGGVFHLVKLSGPTLTSPLASTPW